MMLVLESLPAIVALELPKHGAFVVRDHVSLHAVHVCKSLFTQLARLQHTGRDENS